MECSLVKGPSAGFFAFIYFAGLRPAEARGVRLPHPTVRSAGWDEAVPSTSQQTPGQAWTDSGVGTEQRRLKNLERSDHCIVPLHAELVAIVCQYVDQFRRSRQPPLRRTHRQGRDADHTATPEAGRDGDDLSRLASALRPTSRTGHGTAWTSCSGSTPSPSANR